MIKILVIDDEIEMLESIKKILSQRKNYQLTLIQDGREALKKVVEEKFDLILTDLRIGNISGIDVLKKALSKYPDSPIIVISGYGTIEYSVKAMQEGAFDFIEKPFSSRKLFECIDRALNQNTVSGISPNKKEDQEKVFSGFIYKSNQIQDIINVVNKIATGNMNVLITGESGTGKELIARAIHNLSRRNLNPFVPVNCGALPENLFESELFGHERGAFTGAMRTKPGLLEFSNQGTFFFDEIGDMSFSLQVKLLRMLEDRKIRRVGGQREIDIDVRIIAATNKDLTCEVREKKFREDLYYRLNTIQIEIPPLRERREDIIPLAHHYLDQLCVKNDKDVKFFSPETEDAMRLYDWPGNVRELQNLISRAFYLCSSDMVQKSDFPLPVSEKSINIDYKSLDQSYKDAKEYVLENFEVEYLTHHLKKNKGNISKTAIECGLDRRSIHRIINKYNIVYQE
jgi:two-component system response regulator HydG